MNSHKGCDWTNPKNWSNINSCNFLFSDDPNNYYIWGKVNGKYVRITVRHHYKKYTFIRSLKRVAYKTYDVGAFNSFKGAFWSDVGVAIVEESKDPSYENLINEILNQKELLKKEAELKLMSEVCGKTH